MPYGSSNNGMDKNMSDIKKKLKEKMPNVDMENISPNDMKDILLNEINNNQNINLDDSVKEKINSGDIDGLKDEIIKYLSKNKADDGTNEKLIKMLKNNDMDGLKSQLMEMLFKGMSQQKKNEINENHENNISNDGYNNSSSFDESLLLNSIMDKAFLGIKDDNRILLLNSIKPFVSEKRQKGIDDCVRIMKMITFVDKIKGKAGL